MVEADKRMLLDWDALEVGETFETYRYLLTQEMVDTYRQGVMDSEASFPTISHKVDVKQYNAKYRDSGSVNARCAFQCYNPPIPGKTIDRPDFDTAVDLHQFIDAVRQASDEGRAVSVPA